MSYCLHIQDAQPPLMGGQWCREARRCGEKCCRYWWAANRMPAALVRIMADEKRMEEVEAAAWQDEADRAHAEALAEHARKEARRMRQEERRRRIAAGEIDAKAKRREKIARRKAEEAARKAAREARPAAYRPPEARPPKDRPLDTAAVLARVFGGGR